MSNDSKEEDDYDFEWKEQRKAELEKIRKKRGQQERDRANEFKRHKDQAYNERAIFNDNRSNIDDFALKVNPPEADYQSPSGSYQNGQPVGYGNDGAQRMHYSAWYGNPFANQQFEYELRRKYNGNLTSLPSGTSTGGGGGTNKNPLWDEGGTDVYDSDEEDDALLGKRRRDGTYNDEVDPGVSTSSKSGKNAGKGDSGPDFSSKDILEAQKAWESGNRWQYEKDPYGSGKSYLLRELKRKFLEMTSPIVDFVSTYLAMTGHQSENGIYDLIKMISHVERANPMQEGDFQNLIRHMYSQDPNIASALVGHLASYVTLQKKKKDLSKAVENYRKSNTDEARKKAKRVLVGLRKDISDLDELLAEDDNYKDLARKLKARYEYVASGDIVFVLNNVFRSEAQMVLDEINGFLHGKHTTRYFTLLEIMNSSHVRAKFIRMMIITKTSINVGGVTPISMLSNNGSLAGGNTMADRMNNGTYRGNGDFNKTVVIQSRPTQANLVAGSMEYLDGLNYFRRVKKKRDGSNSLIYDFDGNSLVYSRGYELSNFLNSFGAVPTFPSKLLPYKEGPYGEKKRGKRPAEEALENIYYDVQSNTYKRRDKSNDPTYKGVYGSYEESLGVFVREKEMQNKKQRKMLVKTDDDDFVQIRKGYGDPVADLMDLQRPSNRNRRYNNTAATYSDPITGERGLVSPLIMSDPAYARRFYSTGRPSGPYNIGKMLAERTGYR